MKSAILALSLVLAVASNGEVRTWRVNAAGTPCLPENNPFGNAPYLVGPLGAVCGAVSVQSSTWGAIKALYRSP